MIKTAVILAAGYGKRLSVYNKPKGFVNIAGRPLIEYSISALKQHGIERIIIGTGFKDEEYEALAAYYSGEVVTGKNEDYLKTGSLRTLFCLKDLIDSDFLLLESDLLYDAHCLGKLMADPHPNAIILASSSNDEDGVYVQADQDENLVSMSKDARFLQSPENGILVGITKMSIAAFKELMEIAPQVIAENPVEHYDFAFHRIKSKFHVLRIDNLIFTEIDTDEQLRFALNVVYPKLTIPYYGAPAKKHR